jgi:phage terminase large subunit-like protein
MTKKTISRREARAIMEFLLQLPPEDRALALRRLPPSALLTVAESWFWRGHRGQRARKGDWLTWLLRAGRGFGKTRAGAEWIWARVRQTPGARIALVGANLGEVGRIMVTGPSGLIATAGAGEGPRWLPSVRTLRFKNGAEAFAYSAERPDSLRGPEHDFAWCDELAKWRHADATWDNLALGMRRGEQPRVVVTTTPRAVPLLRRIRALERFSETHGTSFGNLHLPGAHLGAIEAAYGGTRLGRQELGGELIEDVEGALWPREMIEMSRVENRDCPSFRRVVVGVDPPASAAGTCGISVCALGEDGILYVLADASESGLSPDGWARSVARAAETWGPDRVVAEANNGGEMVASVLRGAAPSLPVKLVHASRGKVPRAEPVAAAFERGEAKFAGRFPALEDELAGMVTGGRYEGPGASPDRADAMVWAMTELMATPKAEPRIRRL